MLCTCICVYKRHVHKFCYELIIPKCKHLSFTLTHTHSVILYVLSRSHSWGIPFGLSGESSFGAVYIADSFVHSSFTQIWHYTHISWPGYVQEPIWVGPMCKHHRTCVYVSACLYDCILIGAFRIVQRKLIVERLLFVVWLRPETIGKQSVLIAAAEQLRGQFSIEWVKTADWIFPVKFRASRQPKLYKIEYHVYHWLFPIVNDKHYFVCPIYLFIFVLYLIWFCLKCECI